MKNIPDPGDLVPNTVTANSEIPVYTEDFLLDNLLARDYDDFVKFMRGQGMALIDSRPAYFEHDYYAWVIERQKRAIQRLIDQDA